MNFSKVYQTYLSKHVYEYTTIPNRVSNPDLIVVIPCYDEGDITEVLHSLYLSYLFSPVETLVIVVINATENVSDEVIKRNEESVESIEAFVRNTKKLNGFFINHILENNMPEKHAGVGLARKTGMDSAVRVFYESQKEGVIVCLDADSQVSPNYLITIYEYFKTNSRCDAVSIHFEHSFDEERYGKEVIESIIDYELHLRVFIHFQKWLNVPYAFQTIGSSMAVKASSYVLYGGMNKRKAGEDFYFLHKIGDKGKVGLLNKTMVIPSPRISHRVPFGTGKAIGDALSQNKKINTYHPLTFDRLKHLLQTLPEIYEKGWDEASGKFDSTVVSFFEKADIRLALSNCKENSKTFESFQKRFYQWFNAFKLMKYCHFMRDFAGLSDVPTLTAYQTLGNFIQNSEAFNKTKTSKEALLHLRSMDRSI